MEYIKSSISILMEKWSRGGPLLLIPIVFYFVLYLLIRENGLINDELSLYHYLTNTDLFNLWKLNWSGAFKFTDSAYLYETPYFRPILNYIYTFGFWLYDNLSVTPLILNWFILIYLGFIVGSFIDKETEVTKPYLIAAIYLLLPFNFEAALFFPNLSDILIHIIAVKLLLFHISIKEYNINNVILSSILILFGLFVKEAAIIFIMIPLSAILIKKEKVLIQKNISYLITFLACFTIYYLVRNTFISSNSVDFSLLTLIINFIKGSYNFLFMTQDLNISTLVFIPILFLFFQILKSKSTFLSICIILFITAPVGILQPDERFFHIAYFTLAIIMLNENKKKILKYIIIISFIVLSYKVYSTFVAKQMRINAKTEFSKYLESEKYLVTILPYRHGNEAEIFFNGANYYLDDNNIIPILVKERNLLNDMNIKIEKESSQYKIYSNSNVFIPKMKGDSLLLSDIKIIKMDDTLLLSFGNDKIRILNMLDKKIK